MDRPKTRYARSGDLRIAYQVHGSGAHDIVFIGGSQANLETAWQFPEAVRLFERLGRFARVIRFDRRDHGLSDAADDVAVAPGVVVHRAAKPRRVFLDGRECGAGRSDRRRWRCSR